MMAETVLTNLVIEMSAIKTRACFVKPRGTNWTLYPWLRIIPVVIPIVALTYLLENLSKIKSSNGTLVMVTVACKEGQWMKSSMVDHN